MGKVGQSTTSGSADTSGLQNLLGIAAVGGGLYKNLGGTWLNNLWGSSANESAALAPYFTPIP
jgi:hypothetical protein